MNPEKKAIIRQQTEEQLQAHSQEQGEQANLLEFATVEELLRHDTLHTPVPPSIEQRLEGSLSQLPPPARRSWWRRLFGGSSL
jgi:hypothetical protein